MDAVVQQVELTTIEHWSVHPVGESIEAPFVGATPAVGTFDRVIQSSGELQEELEGGQPRWALDVVLSLEDVRD